MIRKKFSKISDREFDKLIDEYDIRIENNIFSDHYSKERILLKLLHDDKKILKKKLKEAEIQVTTLRTECALKDDTMKYLQTKMLERESKFQSMKDKTKLAVDVISEKMKKYTSEFNREESTSTKTKNELEMERLKMKISEQESQIKSINRENFQYRRQLTQEKSSFELQEREYQSLVSEKREQLRVLHVTIEELKLRNEELIKERDVYHDFAKQYRTDKQEMINKYNEVVRVLKTKEKRIGKNSVKIKKLKETIAYLHEALDESKIENRNLKRQMNKLKKQIREVVLRKGGEGISSNLLKRISESTERIKVISRKRIRNISAHREKLKKDEEPKIKKILDEEEADTEVEEVDTKIPIPRIVLEKDPEEGKEEEEILGEEAKEADDSKEGVKVDDDENGKVKVLSYEDYSSKESERKKFRRRKGGGGMARHRKNPRYASPLLKISENSSDRRRKGSHRRKKKAKRKVHKSKKIEEAEFVDNDRRNDEGKNDSKKDEIPKEEEPKPEEDSKSEEEEEKKGKKKYQVKREELNRKILSSCTNNPERDLQGLNHIHHVNPKDNMEYDEIMFLSSSHVSHEEEKEKKEDDDKEKISEEKHQKLLSESKDEDDIDLSSSTEELLEEVRRSPNNQEKQRMMNFQNIKFPSFLVGNTNPSSLNLNDPSLSKNQRMCLEFVNKRVKKKKLRLRKSSKKRSKRRSRRRKEMEYIRDEYEFFSSEDEDNHHDPSSYRNPDSDSDEDIFYEEKEEEDGKGDGDDILMSVRGIFPSIGGVRQPFKHYKNDQYHRQQIRIVSDLPSFKISSTHGGNKNYRTSVSHPENEASPSKRRGSVILSADIAPQTKVQKVRSRSARNVVPSNDASSKLENYQNGWTKDFIARKKRTLAIEQKKRLRVLNKSWKKNLYESGSYFSSDNSKERKNHRYRSNRNISYPVSRINSSNTKGRSKNVSSYSYTKSLKVDMFGNKLYT